jgi:hypothetical protein
MAMRNRKLHLFTSLYDFLDVSQRLQSCDLIVAVAGRPERKSFALECFQQGLAPRLILSVARYEVRRTAALAVPGPELLAVRDATPPADRHFWIDFADGETLIRRAQLKKTGTFGELQALAEYLDSHSSSKIALISSSLHLRRIQFCCSRIPFYRTSKVLFWAAPASDSSISREQWWRHGAGCKYLLSEYIKLAGYKLLYR